MKNRKLVQREGRKLWALLVGLLVSMTAVGQTTYTHTIGTKTWSDLGEKSLNEITWNLDASWKNSTGYFGYDSTKGQQVGSGNNPATSVFLSTEGISGVVKQIRINSSGAKDTNAAMSVSVGGSQYGEAVNLTSTATEYTFSGEATGDIVVSWTQTSSKAIYYKSITVVYEEVLSMSTPSFSVESGIYFDAFNVTVNAEDGAEIYYTKDGTTPSAETGILYASPIEIDATTTLKAIAVKGEDCSNVASATYTIGAVANTMAEAKALASGTPVKLVLNNVYVTGVKGNDVFMEDATGGVDLYASGAGYKVGDVLNGFIIGTYELYKSLPEITGADCSNVEVTTGTKEPMVVTIADLTGANASDYYCRLVKVEDVIYSDGMLMQNESSIALYNKLGFDHTLYEWPVLADVTAVMGVFNENSQLYISSEADIENVSSLDVPEASWSAATFTADLNEANVFPAFTTNSDGEVAYTSSEEAVATIDAEGAVTIKAVGTTTITASVSATATYSAISKSYTLTVVDASALGTKVALVAERNGAYYAMSTTLGDKKDRLMSEPVHAVNGKVIKEAWSKSIDWYVNTTEGTIKSAKGNYVGYAGSSTDLTAGANSYVWNYDQETGYWMVTTEGQTKRALGLYNDDTYFKAYIPSATYPAAVNMTFADGYVRNVTSGNYGTICLPNAVAANDVAGATFYSIAGKVTEGGNTYIALQEVTEGLEAGVPYIFQATAATLVAAYNGTAAVAPGSNNGLVGAFEQADVTAGNYVLSNNEIRLCGTGVKVGANRAYINMEQVPVVAAEVAANCRLIHFEDVTAVGAAAAEDAVVDVYRLDGVRVRKGVLASQALNGLAKGLYIVNGKKVSNQ